MAQYETVSVERKGDVAIVSLNRPDVLNAFNALMCSELLLAVTQVNEDDGIRVAVLTGKGRAFSAGADLTESLQPGANVIDTLNNAYKPVLMAISDAPQPWISAVNGAAAGIASAFAMNCDLTVMAEDGYLYQAFTAIGLIPDGGATWHLAHTVGRKRAYDIIVSGEKLSANQCLELGLCNRVVAPDFLLEKTLEWAEELAQKSPLSLRYAKQSLNQSMVHSMGDTISNEADLQQLCITSEDAAEGVSAFMQKRAPQWRGR